MLRFMGLRRVGHDWATELNWTEDQHKRMQPWLLTSFNCVFTRILQEIRKPGKRRQMIILEMVLDYVGLSNTKFPVTLLLARRPQNAVQGTCQKQGPVQSWLPGLASLLIPPTPDLWMVWGDWGLTLNYSHICRIFPLHCQYPIPIFSDFHLFHPIYLEPAAHIRFLNSAHCPSAWLLSSLPKAYIRYHSDKHWEHKIRGGNVALICNGLIIHNR